MVTDRARHAGRRVAAWLGPGVLLAALLGSSGCGEPSGATSGTTLAVKADDPWSGPALADFALVEAGGRRVARADLLGRPSVVDFVFTTCSGPCPRMSARMRELQQRLAGAEVRLVSFTVDPATDTPEVLQAYALGFGADPERWWFLTGEEKVLDDVVASVQLARAVDRGAPLGLQVSHSEKFVVLDARGVVRGYYPSATDADLAAAAARARWLAEHPGR